MRSSFDLADWFDPDRERFRLGDDDVQQLVELLAGSSQEPGR
jgi:hypothetical protein